MSIQFRTRSQTFGVDPDTLTGACCQGDAEGTCNDNITLKNCYSSGGNFFPNQTCDNVDCEVGVCCKEGQCYSLTFEGCLRLDGFWAGKNFDCENYDCCSISTQETQACCIGNYSNSLNAENKPVWSGSCKDIKPCDCIEQGGSPRGPNSHCAEIDAVGGCGVTGATAHGACCVDGNCLSPESKIDFGNIVRNYQHGFTPGDCSALGGYYGGSGSTCGAGTSFDTSWPCSWPTGACCFGNQPFNGITYCSAGKTYGDCLDAPPGGSGGLAWKSGVTCGEVLNINGVNCDPPSVGVCCIPERFQSQTALNEEDESGIDTDGNNISSGNKTNIFTYDYRCYQTTSVACESSNIDGAKFTANETCDTIDCCEFHGDCTEGPEGTCCQYDTNGQLIACTDETEYRCHLINAESNSRTTIFDPTMRCSDEGSCGSYIFRNSCCVWERLSGNYVGCYVLDSENQSCPPENMPTTVYRGETKFISCEDLDCGSLPIGACCFNGNCSNTTRANCDVKNGDFYPSLRCDDNCNQLPCCAYDSLTDLVGCATKLSEDSVSCIDKYNYPSLYMDEDTIYNILLSNGFIAESIEIHPSSLGCEDCSSPCGLSRGTCCWYGNCIPNLTEEECLLINGNRSTCQGKPFATIEESFSLVNVCTDEKLEDVLPDCSSDQNNSTVPEPPINLRASTSAGSNVTHMMRAKEYPSFANPGKYNPDGTWKDPDCQSCREANEYANLHGTYIPANIYLTWKTLNSSNIGSPRNNLGTPCVNSNMRGCAPLNETGTCCVQEPCYSVPIEGRDDSEICYRCLENLSECECANLSGALECNSSTATSKYKWTRGSISCNDCPCNDSDLLHIQTNECENNSINRPEVV